MTVVERQTFCKVPWGTQIDFIKSKKHLLKTGKSKREPWSIFSIGSRETICKTKLCVFFLLEAFSCPKLQHHYVETVYYLLLSSYRFLVPIFVTSEISKSCSILETLSLSLSLSLSLCLVNELEWVH